MKVHVFFLDFLKNFVSALVLRAPCSPCILGISNNCNICIHEWCPDIFYTTKNTLFFWIIYTIYINLSFFIFSDENIWKKFKRKFNAKNEISVRRHYDDYYGRKFSIELQEQSPSTLKKLDVNTFRKLDGAKRNFHADAVLANWNSPV